MLDASTVGGISDASEYWLAAVASRMGNSSMDISPLRNKPIAAHAQLTLANEMDAMARAMCSLRTRYNALSLISCLPPEVLSNIFLLHMIAAPPSKCDQDGYPHSASPLGWIEVTHVCQHWRDTALRDPSLWSNITFILGLEWANTMLTRAKATPLHVACNVGTENAGFIPHHIHHTRHLRVRGPDTKLKPIIESLSSTPNQLEHLEIFQHTGSMITLPEDIYSSTPYLRHIVLKGCYYPWTAPFPTNLAHLEIKLTTPDFRRLSSTATLDDVLDSLENLPSLETLILRNCLPSTSPAPMQNRIVTLPRLRLMRVVNTGLPYLGITQYLVVPPSSRIVVKDQLSYSPGIQCCTLPILDQALAAEVKPVTTLSIKKAGPQTFQVCAWRIPHSELPAAMSRPACMDDLRAGFHIELRRKPLPAPDVELDTVLFHAPHINLADVCLRQLPSILHLDDLRTLAIHTTHLRWSPADWAQTFRCCRKVEHVVARGPAALHACIALGAKRDGSRNSENDLQDEVRQQFAFFPNLRMLALEKIPFLETFAQDLQGEVKEALAIRAKAGIAPQLLLTRCLVDDGVIDSLKEVCEVLWDGYGLQGNEEGSDMISDSDYE